MYQKIRPHLPQLLHYLLSGGTAAALELGSYKLLLWAGLWYVIASPISGLLGLVSAFLLHKYFVFRKKEGTSKHVVRYTILQTWNFFAQWGLVYIFVEHVGTGPFVAKILGIGCTVLWNFFLYKFLVYV